MIESIVILSFYLISSVFVGAALWFIYWCIGEPQGVQGDGKVYNVNAGRIFSVYGIWVLKKFNAFELAQTQKIAGRFEILKRQALKKYEIDAENIQAQQLEQGDEIKEISKLDKQLNELLRATNINLLLKYTRLNPYKALGACYICFSTYLAIIAFVAINFLIIKELSALTVIFSFCSLALSSYIGKIFLKF